MSPRRATSTAHAIRDLARVACVGYLRVSSDAQAAEDRTSLDDQRKAISARALTLGLTVGEWFVDSGISGATAEKRPAFMTMRASCEAHQRPATSPGLILVLNDSRFGRFVDPAEAGFHQFALKRTGWIVRFCEGDETDDVMTRGIMRFMGSVQSSQYREALQRNTRRGMRGSSEQGLWTRREPYGYRRKVVLPLGRERVLEPGQRKADDERVSLVPHDVEAAVVRRIFANYDNGQHSMRSLSRWLKVHAPARVWSPHAVQIILSNITYCGDIVSGRRASSAEQYGKRDAHPAIISRELFARVQTRLKSNREQPRAARSDWLLSGIVTCSHCHEPYAAGGLGSRRADGQRNRFYADRGGREDRKVGKLCPGKMGTVSRHLLDDAVVGLLRVELSKRDGRRRIEAAVDRFLAGSGSTVSEDAKAARHELVRLESRRDKLVAAIAEGTLTNAEAGRQLGIVRAQIDATNEQVQRLAFQGRRAAASMSERDRLVAMATDFAKASALVSGSELRELVRPWIANSTFDKHTRVLTVAIRRLPATAPLSMAPSSAREGQKQDVVVRRMVIGGRRAR